MDLRDRRMPSATRAVVLLAVGGAALFGAYLAYLAWSNDSFPVQQRPFGNYAEVVSTSFNGTEVLFEVKWLAPGFLPLYAQVTSSTSEVANTPVCGLGLGSATAGQLIPMPFGIGRPSPSLTNLELSIAVKDVATGSEFTIVYQVDSLSAINGDLSPSNFSCQQRPGGA